VGWLRRASFWATAAMWAYCLTAHLSVVAGLAPPVIDPLIVGAVVAPAIWVFTWPHRGGPFPGVRPPWYAVALMTASFLCLVWPMAVGSGVPGDRPAFGDGGVPAGEPGDRYLTDHGRRVRALTEEEYRRVRRWEAVRTSAFAVGVSGIALGFVLHLRRLGTAPNRPLRQTAAGVSGSGTS
jgi:hypothetical protein